jgi:beta-galactosidase
LASGKSERLQLNFNADWHFQNQEDMGSTNALPTLADYNFEKWESVTLPHTAKIEPLVVIHPWEGISWYKKDFAAQAQWRGKRISISFEAIMQQAEIWFNGKLIVTHYGGYLPFTIDISQLIDFEKPNRIVVKADNHDHPEVLPGKPIKDLDFCYYSGIYRTVSLIVTNPLHITDAVNENKVASGGVRVWYPTVSKEFAEIAIQTHLRNENSHAENFQFEFSLIDKKGRVVHSSESETQSLNASSENTFKHYIKLQNQYAIMASVSTNYVELDSTSIYLRNFDISF